MKLTPLENPRQLIDKFLAERHLSLEACARLVDPYGFQLHEPELLPNAEEFVRFLHQSKDKVIGIIPDYDADGVLSGTVLNVALSLMGFNNKRFLYAPTTLTGYGTSIASVNELLEAQPDTELIITTDNGIAAFEGIAYARSLGIDVLVSDHHLGSPKDVAANVIVDPNQYKPNPYPFKDISGTVVIWKLMLLYAKRYTNYPIYEAVMKLVSLAGLSTISDVMPLLDENRTILNAAIDLLKNPNEFTNVSDIRVLSSEYYEMVEGFRCLLDQLESDGALKYGFDEETFGFTLAPILNSPRRMTDRSLLAFDLFRARFRGLNASDVARDLVNLNSIRKLQVQQISREVLTKCDFKGQLGIAICVNAKGGFAGLLAGTIVRQTHLPTFVFSCESEQTETLVDPMALPANTVVTASGRAPSWCHLYHAFQEIRKAHPTWIHAGGGHAQAMGMSLYSQYWDDFCEAFNEQIKQQYEAYLDKVDVEIKRPGIGLTFDERFENRADFLIDRNAGAVLVEAIDKLNRLKPFGQGFRKPTFSLVCTVNTISARYMGADKQHVRFNIAPNFNLIQWNNADYWRNVFDDQDSVTVEVVGTLSINCFNGVQDAQMIVDEVDILDNNSES